MFDILTVTYQFSGGGESLRRGKLNAAREEGAVRMEEERGDLGPLLVEQFREQMNNLAAAIQLLTPVVREKGGEQYEPYLAILYQSLYRMMRMLGNVEYLELDRCGQPEGKREILDLAGLCRTLAGQVSGLTEQAGVSFAYEEERSSLLLQGDGRMLRRMLLGLIANAVKAAGKGGQAGLRLAVRQDRAVLTVWDNGPGLRPPEEHGLLTRSGGPGRGLRVARSIAAGHGGTIVLQQQEDRGCRAVVSLPIKPPQSGGELHTPGMGYDGSGGFSDLLMELAGVLPYQAFLPGALE